MDAECSKLKGLNFNSLRSARLIFNLARGIYSYIYIVCSNRDARHLAGFLSLIDQKQFPRRAHRQFRTTVLKTPLEELLVGTVCKNTSNCPKTVTILLFLLLFVLFLLKTYLNFFTLLFLLDLLLF